MIGSASDKMLSYGMKATAKPENAYQDEEDEGGCSFDEEGNPSCAVNVPIIDMEDTGLVRAEESGIVDGPSECEKYLARLFADPGAYFFNNSEGKNDLAIGPRIGDADSHLYGSQNDVSVSTGIYIPEGGRIVEPNTTVPESSLLGSSRDDDGTHNAN